MNRSVVLGLSTLFAACTLSLVAAAKLSTIGGSSVTFETTGKGLSLKGEGGGLRAEEADGKLVLTSAVQGIKTGISERDKHLKTKYIDAKSHPHVKLTIDRSKLTLPEDGKRVKGSVTGQLSLAGKTKPVKVSYSAARTGSDYHVDGSFQFNVSEYMKRPCLAVICVAETVNVQAKFKLRDQ